MKILSKFGKSYSRSAHLLLYNACTARTLKWNIFYLWIMAFSVRQSCNKYISRSSNDWLLHEQWQTVRMSTAASDRVTMGPRSSSHMSVQRDLFRFFAHKIILFVPKTNNWYFVKRNGMKRMNNGLRLVCVCVRVYCCARIIIQIPVWKRSEAELKTTERGRYLQCRYTKDDNR